MEYFELSNPWLIKLTSFLLWSNLYIYTVINSPEKSPEWCSRVVTLLHGTVAAIVGFYQCGVRTLNNADQLTSKVMPSQYALMLWSWGYFAFDLLWCVVYWTDAILMLFHHFSALAAITIYMQMDYTGCTFACTLVLMEITNPLLQMRWFLKKQGYGDTYIFLFIEVLYLILFLSLRGILGTCIIYWVFKTDIFCIEEKIITVILYIVSIAFIYDIAGYVVYKYKKELVSIKNYWLSKICKLLQGDIINI
ncbi:TLC domain-containing protein 5-like isoform X2 [Anticarsia gemmatalis]|uniref:TLC domain-containing protein 5-like isoform X2 n=1 Tax=Anticarsia gemmatalis TaxID=129554 RepID=UPI003F75A2FB